MAVGFRLTKYPDKKANPEISSGCAFRILPCASQTLRGGRADCRTMLIMEYSKDTGMQSIEGVDIP